jgi:hypothetical protein
MDSLDLASPEARKPISLPPLTFAVLKVKWGAKASPRILQAQGAAGISRIHADAAGSEIERLAETQFTLGPPHAGYGEYYLVIPNPDFTRTATVEFRDPEAAFYAYPNPVLSASSSPVYFSHAKGMVFPAQVLIYSEAGGLIRSLDFPDSDQSLAWDLKDDGGLSVKPGLYYYRQAAEPLKTLIVLR